VWLILNLCLGFRLRAEGIKRKGGVVVGNKPPSKATQCMITSIHLKWVIGIPHPAPARNQKAKAPSSRFSKKKKTATT
jgi:hypothetical protein